MLLIDTFPNLLEPAVLVSLFTLTFLEVVLGIDNIIFISIISSKLPKEKQNRIRIIGLGLAMLFRILLLFGIVWIIKLSDPVFEISFIEENGAPLGISWKDIILFTGGLFLIAKSVSELHHKVSVANTEDANQTTGLTAKNTVFMVLLQILMIDAVFSIDSILTAVGLVDNIWIMIIAVMISISIMMLFANKVADFIDKNPTLQILALSFLVAIGMLLVAEGFHQHINKGYIYSSIAFALFVEILNLRMRKKMKQ